MHLNLSEALCAVIKEHHIEVTGTDTVFFFLQEGMSATEISCGTKNLLRDRRFLDEKGERNAASYAVGAIVFAQYRANIQSASAAPNPPAPPAPIPAPADMAADAAPAPRLHAAQARYRQRIYRRDS